MFVTIRKILILFSLAGLSSGLVACAEEEQNRLFTVWDLSWKGRSTIVGRTARQLVV